MEAIILLLLGTLVVVSLLASAFRKDAQEVSAKLAKAENALAKAEQKVDMLRKRPTWRTVRSAYKAGQRDVVRAVAAEHGLRVAERTAAEMQQLLNGFTKRNTR